MTVIKTLLIIVVVVIIGLLGFIYSGLYNIAADEPHWGVTRRMLATAREQSIQTRMDKVVVPANLTDSERYRRGAQSYASMCEVCHLGPGIKPTPVHEGLMPQPPDLAKVAAHHSPEYLFWTTKHGIKLTGMPAWGETHSDEELWDIIAFLEKLSQMTPEQYSQLASNGHGH